MTVETVGVGTDDFVEVLAVVVVEVVVAVVGVVVVDVVLG